MHVITSINNRYVKLIRSLQERTWRRKRGFYLIEGPRLIGEARQTDIPLEVVLYTPAFGRERQGGRLVKLLRAGGNRCFQVTEKIMQTIGATVTPPGIVAAVPLPIYSLAELLQSNTPDPLLLIADGLQDPGNLGTIWRTALGAGVSGLILTPGSVDPFNPKAIRAAAGATFKLPVVTGIKSDNLIKKLKAAGFRLVVADVRAKAVLWQTDFSGRLALAVGSENQGPSGELLAAADIKVSIPLMGPVESLNAAVAAAVLLYETVRQRQQGCRGIRNGG